VILATGATGRVGRQLVTQLAAHGAAVRAVARDPDAAGLPAGFAANALIWADQIRAGDVVRWPYGAAARSLVHERDLVAVACLALTEDGHAGARYVLTGPSRLTQAEQVQAIGTAIGRHLRWEELPEDVARKLLAAAFGDAAFADSALSTWAGFVRRPEILTTTVQELTGTPARSFGQWAADHADDFR
jgi:uncharacterized protein YbjT (DUF2867 family)